MYIQNYVIICSKESRTSEGKREKCNNTQIENYALLRNFKKTKERERARGKDRIRIIFIIEKNIFVLFIYTYSTL